jgi:peptidoglycan/LPS O-acetylase OafA/YrhL
MLISNRLWKGRGVLKVIQHFKELDSLRGIAAVSVIISHILLIYPMWSNGLFDYSPLYLFRAGHEAVIFFFILSGFVLSLAFSGDRQPDYKGYITRRFFRIYIPYAVAMIIVFFTCYAFSVDGFNNASNWLSGKWNEPATITTIIQHLLLLGKFSTTEYNPIVWSLTQEMRISLIFPLIMILVKKLDWKVLFVGFMFSVLSGINNIILLENKVGYYMSFTDTLHFILMFLIGAILATHRNVLVEKYTNLSPVKKLTLIIVGVLCYCYSRIASLLAVYLGLESFSKFMLVVSDWGIAIGASIFIVAALSRGRLSTFLLKKPILYLGKISYSLYLFHLPVLFTAFFFLSNRLATEVIFLIATVSILLVSSISYYFVEKPTIQLGKKISQRHKRNKKNAKEAA